MSREGGWGRGQGNGWRRNGLGCGWWGGQEDRPLCGGGWQGNEWQGNGLVGLRVVGGGKKTDLFVGGGWQGNEWQGNGLVGLRVVGGGKKTDLLGSLAHE